MKNLIFAFLYKEWKTTTKFKFHNMIKFIFSLIQILIFYFLCKLISAEYFTFLFLGLLFSRIFSFTGTTLVENLKQAQYFQTINNLISTPYTEFIVFTSEFISKFLFLVIEIILLLITGSLLGTYFSLRQSLLIFIWCIFLVPIFYWYGIITVAVSLLARKTENFVPIINAVIDILSGVYFTTEILPWNLNHVSQFLPTTQILYFIREAVLMNNTNFVFLIYPLITTFVLCPVSIFIFNTVMNKKLKDGRLTVY